MINTASGCWLLRGILCPVEQHKYSLPVYRTVVEQAAPRSYTLSRHTILATDIHEEIVIDLVGPFVKSPSASASTVSYYLEAS